MSSFQSTVYGDFAAAYESSRLVDICEPKEGVQTGPFGSQLHQEDYVPVGTPIITVEHLGENRILHSDIPRVSEEDRERLSKYTLLKGDIVFSRVGSVDRRALVRDEEDGWLFSGRCLRVRPNQSMIDPGYLSYFFGLPTFKEYIRAIAVGATMPSLNTKILSDVSIYYPPLPEQRAIAHILGTLDDKIELNRRMNETLEAMARSIFKSWFVDFDPVRAKAEGRDTGLPEEIADLFPDSFEETELGEVPKGWRIGTLGDIADVIDCLHSKKPERIESGKPLLQLCNIRDDGLIDMEDTYYFSESDYQKWISRIEASFGDCVITNVGRVGAVAQLPEYMEAALGRNMTAIRCHHEYYYPTYLIELLLSDYMKGEISLKTDNGTVMSALNVKNIPKLSLVLPPKKILQAFEFTASTSRRKMEANHQQSLLLKTLRNSLLPKLMSGEIRGITDFTKY